MSTSSFCITEIGQAANQIATTIKEVEVTSLLSNSAEFRECRKQYAENIKAGATQQQRDTNLQRAQKCFREKITDGKLNPEKLKKLSEELGLQSYGLVKGNNVKEIQEYLDKKMYKALTGVDLDEQDLKKKAEALKFKNKKQVDQSLFIDLYKTQLNKNALFELSRFCFNNLRSTGLGAGKATFGEHWGHLSTMDDQQIKTHLLDISNVDDSGTPEFIQKYNDTTDKEAIYQDMFDGINIQTGSNTIPVSKLSAFFTACGFAIPKLCEEFQKTAKSNLQAVDTGSSKSETAPKTTKGAAACLAKARLQELKVAIENSQKTEAEFEKMAADPNHMSGLIDQRKTGTTHFVAGENGESIDNLTNYTSEDMLGDVSNNSNQNKIDECKQTPELEKCKGLVMSQEEFDVATQQAEIEMTAKREVEMARVRLIHKDGAKKLEEYLKDKGYFELAKNAGSLTEDQVAEAIGSEYEARKLATLAEINKRFGGRQISENEAADSILGKVGTAETETKEEKARLAQVVLFNNIVTSNLSIYKDGKEIGRNVNAWEKENQKLSNTVNTNLFSNLNNSATGSKSAVSGQDELGGLEFISQILGK